MSWEAAATILVVAAVIAVLVRNAAAPDAALLAGVAVLSVLGLFSDHLLSGREVAGAFGNEAVVTVGVLFIVAAGLTETGALYLVVGRLLGRPASERSAQARLMLPVAVSSAFLNNTTIVATFVPVVREWSRRRNLDPSRLFMPLSYAAILGGICTLIGTSTNLVVQGLLIEADLPRMGMFTISVVGVPAAIAGLLFILLASGRLLPRRASPEADFADPRQYTVEMLVEPGGEIVGLTIEEAGLRHLRGLYLGHIERAGEQILAVGPAERLIGNDRLVFVGVVDSVVDLQRIRGLRPATDQVFKLADPRPNRMLVEAVVSGGSPLVGKSIRGGRFRTHYEAVVIAVHRNGARIDEKIGDIVLQPGDTLLLETTAGFVARHRDSPDFFLVSGVPESEPRRYHRAPVALLILTGLVVLVALGDLTKVGILPGALAAGALMLLTGCCSLTQVRRHIDWSLLVAIGASIAIGRAVEGSGAAGLLGTALTDALAVLGPVGVLAGVYLTTLLLTEAVTNSAAAVLMFPIAQAAAAQLGVDFMPFALAIAIAASAGFATPLGYQTHLMVYGPGGYRFSDFLRMGVPLDIVIMLVVVLVTPIFFPLG